MTVPCLTSWLRSVANIDSGGCDLEAFLFKV